MATQVQLRRGTGAWHQNFTGALGETTVNTTDFTLHVHDGATPGGHKLQSAQDAVSSLRNRTGAISPQAGDYSAAQVSVAPAGSLAATDVQAALVELDGEATTLTAKVTTVEGKADALTAKLATLDAKVAETQTKGAGVASFKSRTGAVAPMAGDYSAAQVSVAPSGSLAATDVQAALVELDGEASALTTKVAAIEGKAIDAAEKLRILDSLNSKVTTLEGQVADAQTKTGVASFKERTGAISPQAGDYSAAQVSVAPSDGLAATDVQAALLELAQSRLRDSALVEKTIPINESDWIPIIDGHMHWRQNVMVRQLFTDRTLVNPLLTGYRETVESQTVTAAAHTLSDISLGAVKRLTLTVDTTLTLPNLALQENLALHANSGAALSVILVQDGAGHRSATFEAPPGQSIVWDGGGAQPEIANGAGKETLFSFYKIAESPAWKGVRTHKGG